VHKEETRRKFVYTAGKGLYEELMPYVEAYTETPKRDSPEEHEVGDALYAALEGGHFHCAHPLIQLLEGDTNSFNALWSNYEGNTYMHALAQCRPYTVHKSYSVAPATGYGWTDPQAMQEIYAELIAQRANIHSRNKERRSPLYMAAWSNNGPMVKKILDDNADPNCWDEVRRKPLHVAVMHGCDEAAQLLVEAADGDEEGASWSNKRATFTLAKDEFGCNPLPLAQFRKGLCSEKTKQMIEDQMGRDRANMSRSQTEIWQKCLEYSNTWNVWDLRYWVEVAMVSCVDNPTEQRIVEKYIERVRYLARACEMVKPVVSRGVVGVDYHNCSIEILMDIPFEPRKEPDTSAEFVEDQKEKVEEMVLDLSTVVHAFDSPMVVEGCTGGTGSQYWSELAQNRANKIVSMMLTHGCELSKVFPLGTPGGGAKVKVRPKKKTENLKPYQPPPEEPA
jgi:hypothetical protein